MNRLGLRLLISFLSGLAAAAAWIWLSLPGGQSRNITDTHLLLQPEKFRVVAGDVTRKDGSLTITPPGSGRAILSIPVTPFRAGHYRFLRFELEDAAPDEKPPLFFWRRADSNKVETVPLGKSPLNLLDLGSEKSWRGVVTEIGFLLPAGNHRWRIGQIELLPASRNIAALSLLGQWLKLEIWSQHSVHFLEGDDSQNGATLQATVTVWVLASLLIYLLLPGKRQPHLAIPAILLLGWAILDSRWMSNMWRHAQLTWNTFSSFHEEEKYRAAIDRGAYELAQSILHQLPADKPVDIYLPMPSDPVTHYFYAKLPYFLAPHRVHTLAPGTSHGYIVLLGRTPASVDAPKRRLQLNGRWIEGVQLLEKGAAGALYRFGKNEKSR